MAERGVFAEAERDLAAEVALGISGVKRVDNRIRIDPAWRRPPPADGQRSPADIATDAVDSAIICLENTHNRAGGTVQNEEDMAAVRDLADKYKLPLHIDGARIFNAAVKLGVPVATGVFGPDDNSSQLETVVGFGSISTPTPGPSPTPTNLFPPGSDAPIARILIPNAEIDAPVVVKGVDNAGVMIAPDNAYDVAWYDFSAQPGFGGNAVFAAHVDYINVGPAVFWNLKDLEPGDVIDVRLVDGTVYRYADEIFSLGREFVDTLKGRASGRPLRLVVGVAEQ